MNKKLVIFDGNHLAYRALYKFSNLKTFDGVNTSVIYGMPYIAESIIRRLSPDKVVMVFDGSRSKYRLSLLPNYKNREKRLGFDHEDFYRQKDVGMEVFKAFGLEVAYKKEYEADDIITMITRRYSNNGWEVIIVSGDKDFDQLTYKSIDDKKGPISIFNTRSGKVIDYDTLPKVENKGYTAEQTVDYLSLLGDDSDKIPGYPGIGHKRAIKFLKEYGSIKNFLISENKFGKVDNEELRRLWKLNKKLIDLKYFYRKFLIKEQIPWLNPGATFKKEKLMELCGTYEINSFLKPQFINTFKKLNQ